MKKPKFKNNMAQVKPMQDLLIKALPGTQLNLKWVIKNFSSHRSWPTNPHVKNFSADNF
jgi:hypothetical protein